MTTHRNCQLSLGKPTIVDGADNDSEFGGRIFEGKKRKSTLQTVIRAVAAIGKSIDRHICRSLCKTRTLRDVNGTVSNPAVTEVLILCLAVLTTSEH